MKAILLNGLGFVSRSLYLFPQFFEDKATEHLLGMASIKRLQEQEFESKEGANELSKRLNKSLKYYQLTEIQVHQIQPSRTQVKGKSKEQLTTLIYQVKASLLRNRKASEVAQKRAGRFGNFV